MWHSNVVYLSVVPTVRAYLSRTDLSDIAADTNPNEHRKFHGEPLVAVVSRKVKHRKKYRTVT